MKYIKIILTAALLIIANIAIAADIQRHQIDKQNVITIFGEIKPGDSEKFERLAIYPTMFVLLRSDGGNILDALMIGEIIYDKKYITIVGDSTCASACGLIWLAGAKRFSSSTARIGFHAVSNSTTNRESSQGNALVGAYLTKLGFSYKAVMYMTAAAPDEMNWLSQKDAAKIGVSYHELDTKVSSKEIARQKVEGTPGYVEGSKARVEYERWNASLPEGSYKTGVLFWVNNRSLKKLPNCVNVDAAYQRGCNDARDRFTEIDFYRKTNKDYWFGWNSF